MVPKGGMGSLRGFKDKGEFIGMEGNLYWKKRCFTRNRYARRE